VRYIESLLYQVRATDVRLAALPAVVHAARTDPLQTLRCE
jgi:hypothetical protein